MAFLWYLGLHQRMGGDDVWKNDILKLGMKSYRNKMEKASQSNPEQKSYFNRMATHRESRQEQNPQSLYDQDYALNAECVVTGTNIQSLSILFILLGSSRLWPISYGFFDYKELLCILCKSRGCE